MITSVGSWIRGTGRVSSVTSNGPLNIIACILVVGFEFVVSDGGADISALQVFLFKALQVVVRIPRVCGLGYLGIQLPINVAPFGVDADTVLDRSNRKYSVVGENVSRLNV